jgi:hypothetical protein
LAVPLAQLVEARQAEGLLRPPVEVKPGQPASRDRLREVQRARLVRRRRPQVETAALGLADLEAPPPEVQLELAMRLAPPERPVLALQADRTEEAPPRRALVRRAPAPGAELRGEAGRPAREEGRAGMAEAQHRAAQPEAEMLAPLIHRSPTRAAPVALRALAAAPPRVCLLPAEAQLG